MRLPLLCLLAALAASTARAQVPAGGEFRINTYTTDRQVASRVAMDASGGFVVVWTSFYQDGDGNGVFGQRFGEDGAARGAEFQVNPSGVGSQALADVAFGRGGSFLVTWSGTVPGARFDIFARRFAADGTPGPQFQVNTYTTDTQYKSVATSLANGTFVVAWDSNTYDVPGDRVVARQYDRDGIPAGPELTVAGPASGSRYLIPAAASGPSDTLVITWKDSSLPGSAIAARRLDGAGNPLGPKFQASQTPGVVFGFSSVAMAANGSFVVVWEHPSGDGSGYGIQGRLFSPAGTPVGNQFVVNAGTAGNQRWPAVASDDLGNFVVSWSVPGGGDDVFARRFDASGAPRGGEFRVNSFTPNAQVDAAIDADEVGNFVVTWTSDLQDGDSGGLFARRFGGLLPAALTVDGAPSPQSDGNRVLEPGEAVDARPSWRNVNGAAQTFAGVFSGITGPAGATHTITDAAADYGTVANGAAGACSDCYGVGVSAPPSRPMLHWDATAVESITPDAHGQRKGWRLHVGDSFADVGRASGYYRFVETLLHHGVTGGCAAGAYCPQGGTLREQMPVFVLMAREGTGYVPRACGTPMFADVPAASPFCRWIEELARRGVVEGCGKPNYCPEDPVSREQMAVFTLRTLDPQLSPPDCTTPVFADVPASSPFCRWIEELARRGVVSGCGGGNYCPLDAVTREQMAVFIAVTFGLQLYGP